MQIKCPEGWKLVKLSDLGEVNRGRSRHRPRHANHLYGGPYPFVQTGDIKASGGRITEYTQTYSEAGLAQSRLWPAGTMCITIAANIAETAILQFPACFPDSVVGFIADPNQCDVHFVEYMFRYLRRFIQHQASDSGTVQDNINLGTIEQLRFPVPATVDHQRAIARILGALDDKIELNRRMNRTLEAMAAALFKSWFVDFDPVVAKAQGRTPFGMNAETAALFPDRFVSFEQGDIPKDWPIGRLDDLIVLQRGFDLPGSQRTPGPYPVIAASGPSGTHDEFKVQGPGVTTGRSGVLGNVFFVHSDFWPLNTSLWVKEYKNSNVYHAYFLLGDLDFETFNAGSAVPTLNRNHVHNLPTVVPPPPVLDKFAETAAPLFSKQKQNHVEVETLASIRDTLLPKLLSGEVRLRQAEAMVQALSE